MIKKQDLGKKLSQSKDKFGTLKNIHPKLKIALVHAVIMDASILGSAYSWYTRRAIKGYVPSDTHAMSAAAFLIGIFGSAALGGMLVYDYGVGVATTHRAAGKAE